MFVEIGGVAAFAIGVVTGAVLALGVLLLSLLKIHDNVLQKERRLEDKAQGESPSAAC